MDIKVPLTVPEYAKKEYISNYKELTKGTGRLMIFAGDQKIEHMNDDFFGEGIAKDDADPEHLFRIASEGKICAFATQLGLIARYEEYGKVPYIVKINSKTHLVKTRDPISRALVTIQDVIDLKERGVNILGVGYTIYPGSEYEHIMFREASKIILEAHKHGLIAILWSYPRGKNVKNEKDPHLIAGAAGIALCLGADFVKVNYPGDSYKFKETILAAGRTGVLCAGGSKIEEEKFLKQIWEQINISGAKGNATGRNIHQRPLEEAIKMCNAIYAITIEGKSWEEAIKILRG
ncbi:Fructose-bisphosphate aldolase [Methanocaldococcus infernus ME]|uniref:fructose-bisphosphate aldolase n=1 Tax=Methanocaldococcus infernus (strain DSM 11812 / JCM 15783 / ME) TaxID=573063 RepID=D5VR22_METIM|nr:aldolase [Methanocaldococcus infernus]ADG13025.1 Fructose-bisphosphate aldolase [Methanocaldococcus infernus ME]